MSVLGSVSVEASLDMSAIDKQLDSLGSRKLKPIKLGVGLDASGLQQELKQIPSKLDPIKVDLSPNVEDFQRKLQKLGNLSAVQVELKADVEGLRNSIKNLRIDPIKIDLAPNVEDFQEKLRRVARLSPINVEIRADRAAVEKEFQEIGRYAAEGFAQGFDAAKTGEGVAESIAKGVKSGLEIQSPSKVFNRYGKYSREGFYGGFDGLLVGKQVATDLIKGLSPDKSKTQGVVREIENQFRGAKLRVTAEIEIDPYQSRKKLQKLEGEIAVFNGDKNAAKNITDSIEQGFKNAKPKTNIFGSLFKAIGSVALAPIQGAFQGIFSGVGLPLGEKVGSSILKGVESSFGDIIGSFDLLGEKVGEKLSAQLQDALVATGKSTKVVSFFEDLIGLQNIAAESGSAKQKSKQIQSQKSRLAQKELIEQQRNLPFQFPELLAAPAQIKQARISLSEQKDAAVKKLGKIQSSPAAKEMALLQRKAANSLSSSESRDLSALQLKSQSGSLDSKESQKLYQLQKRANSTQISSDELGRLGQLTQLVTQQMASVAKQIQSIDRTFAELDEQEAQIKFVTERPVKALAELGNKSAQEMQALEKEIQQLKTIKQGVLTKLGKSADKSGNIPEKERSQAATELKKAQQFIERRQKRIQELQNELIVPENITTPEGKAEYLRNRQNTLTKRDIASVRKSAKSKSANINILKSDKARTEKLLQEAKAPFELVPAIEKELLQLQSDYESQISIFNQQIEQSAQEAQSALQLIDKIKLLRRNKGAEIQARVSSGEISPEQGATEIESLFTKTQILSNEQTSRGQSALASRAAATQQRDDFIKSTANRKNALLDKREKSVAYLETPEAKKSLQAIEIYEKWLIQSNSQIEQEVKSLQSLRAKEKQLEQKIKNNTQPPTPIKSVKQEIKDSGIKPLGSKNAYTTIAELVAKESGINIKAEQIPKLVQEELPSGSGAEYDFLRNVVNVPPHIAKELQGIPSKDAVEAIIHELVHGQQGNFGKDKSRSSRNLLKANPQEVGKLGGRIESSTRIGIEGIGKTIETANPKLVEKVRAIEEDAYVFTERNLEKIYQALLEELNKVRPDKLKTIQGILGRIDSIQLPQQTGLNSKISLNSSKDVANYVKQNLNAKGVRDLARRMGIDTKNANKEYLLKEISSLSSTSDTRNQIVSLIDQLKPDAYLSSKKGGKQTQELPQAGTIIEQLKAGRKALSEAIKTAFELEEDEKVSALEKISKKSEELQNLAKDLSREFQLTGQQGRQLSGIRAQLSLTTNRSKQGLFNQQQPSTETTPKISEIEKDAVIPAGLRLQSSKLPHITRPLLPGSLLKAAELPAIIPPPPPKTTTAQKIKKLEQEIGKVDTAIEKRLEQLEAEVQLEKDAASIGIKPKNTGRRLSLKRINDEAELNRAKSQVVTETLISPSSERELEEMKRQRGRKRTNPVLTSSPTTLSVDQELDIMRGNAGITGKKTDPDLRTTGLRINNLYRRAVLKFKNSISQKTKIEALETVEQVVNVFADIEKGIETASQVQTASQRVSNGVKNAPKYLRERARNAIFTKTRYLIENSDAINTLVADKTNREPTGNRTRAVQEFNNKRGQLAELVEVYAQAPSKSGFNAIRQTLRDIEKSLQEIGVPLPKVNALLKQYEKDVRELQGKGLVPLDFEIPAADKLPMFVDLFEKFGDTAAKALGPISAIGPAIKGAAAFAATSFLQNFFQNLAQDAFRAYVELDKLKTVLNFASGGISGGSSNLAFIRKQVDDLKIPLNASIQGYTKLEAAARGSSLAGKPNRELFTGLSQASTVLSLSGDETQGITVALGQAISKGKFLAEEQNQLAERIPGLFGIMARAAGVTEAEFAKLRDSGQVITEDFLPKFAKQLQSEFGDAALDASGNAQSAIFDFQNSLLSLQQGVGEGIAPAAVTGINIFTALLKGASASSRELGFLLLSVSAVLAVKMVVALQSVVAQLIATRIATGTLGGGLASLGQALNNSSSAKLSVGLFAALEIVNLLNQAVNTELVQSFDNAAKSADRARKSIEGAFNPEVKKKNPLQAPEASNGFARFVDNTAIAALNFGNDTYRVNNLLIPGGRKPGSRLNTYGQLEKSSIEANAQNQIASIYALMVQSKLGLAQLESGTGEAGKLPSLTKELQVAEQERAVLQAEIKRLYSDKGLVVPGDKRQQLEQKNIQIQKLNTDREAVARPFTLSISKSEQQITSLKSKIDQLKNDEKLLGVLGQDGVDQLIQQYQQALKSAQDFKAGAEQVIGSLRVDPVLTFTQAILKLNLALAEGQEKSELRFTGSREGISKNQVLEFSRNRFASRNAATSSARAELEKNRDNANLLENAVRDSEKSINDPTFQTTLKRLGVSSDASVPKIEDLLSRTQDDADKAILEKLKVAREQRNKLGEARISINESELKVKQNRQENALFSVDDRTSLTKNRLQINENESINFWKKGQLEKVVVEEVVAEKLAKIQVESGLKQKQVVDAQLLVLRGYYEQGDISAEEFHKRQQELTVEQSNLEKQETENRLALQQAVIQRRIKELEFANKKAESISATYQADATRTAKERLLAGGLTQSGQDAFALEQNKIDQKSAADKVSQVKIRIAQNKQLYGEGLKDARDFQQEQLSLNQELAQANLQAVDLKIQAEEKYREIAERGVQRMLRAEDNRFKSLNSRLAALKSSADLYNQSIDTTVKLEESRYNLKKALGDAGISSLEIRKDSANRALELSRKLKDDNLDPAVKTEVNRQLSASGFGNSELAILDQRNRIEDEIAAKKLESLKIEQEYQRQSEVWRLEQQRLAAEIAIYDAQGLQLAAAKSKLEAEGAARIAKLKKDDIAIQEAEISLEIANREAAIADKTLQKKLDILGIQEELAEKAKKTQESTQKSAVEQQLAADAARKQAAALERVESSVNKTVDKIDKVDSDNKTDKPESTTSSTVDGWKNPFDRLTKEEYKKWQQERRKKFSLSGQPKMESDFDYASRIAELRMTGEIQDFRSTFSKIDTSGFDFGGGAGKLPFGYEQSKNGSIYQSYLQKENTVPQPLPTNNPSMNLDFAGLKTSVESIDKKLVSLIGSISNIANRPTNLNISSPQPVSDAAKIYSDLSKAAVRKAGL
ncbi:tape measure protein [Anabaena lutea]|uniref:Tape measure protein n=1 Tax=Anabaena lutea FACHB-196 TaxID=2692881 RepID=A0ABR8FII6_9NOST|nr:tape measure protein [Anabaena lutea]MBD2570057.1 tape measure protein [Anabaena lutea FACHB-196]